MLLFKDAIRLFAAYNEGIINLLGELLLPKGTHMYCVGLCFMLTLPCLPASLFPGKETFEPCVDLLWCMAASSVEQCTWSHNFTLEPEAKARERLFFSTTTNNYTSLYSLLNNNSYNSGLFKSSVITLILFTT